MLLALQSDAVPVNRRSKVSKHLTLRSNEDACAKCRLVPGSAEKVVVVNGEKYHDHHAPRK